MPKYIKDDFPITPIIASPNGAHKQVMMISSIDPKFGISFAHPLIIENEPSVTYRKARPHAKSGWLGC